MTSRDLTVLVIYFLVLAGIGLLCMRRIKVQEDYLLGGRRFGKVLQTFAAFGAGTGASDPVNVGRTSFSSGLSGMWSVMYWLFVTPFYWITAVWYRRMRHLTLGDWYVERYQSRALGAAYAGFGLLFFMTYGSMMFSAIGKVAAPLLGTGSIEWSGHSLGIEYLLVPLVGVAVLIYGIAGGLKAAYWTDLLQGLFIILLSVLLIPFGLSALVEKFGDPGSEGLWHGFRILHEQVPESKFQVVGEAGTGEFPLHRIVAIVLINLVGIVVQPHMIATGGGSAKSEWSARIGLVTGNFLKRLCTVGWALTALIMLALLADSPELLEDPDRVWGVASREILGPLDLGLVGLMLACLLSALMSSLDAFMVVGSGLVVRNVYVPYVNPAAGERECLAVARLTGAIVVGGAVAISLSIMDVFRQLQITWVIPVLFAAPFWIGMYWRRATAAAAWLTVLFSAAVFFAIPWAAPRLAPGLRQDPSFLATTDRLVRTTRRPAAPADVARRRAEIRRWEERRAAIDGSTAAEWQETDRPELGPRPVPLAPGDELVETRARGGRAVYWSGGVRAISAAGEPLDLEPLPVGPPVRAGEHVTEVILRFPPGTRLEGLGSFQLDFLLYRWTGLDLSAVSDATLDTLSLPPKILTPFLVMILLSLITPRVRREALDRFYVKMKTPVHPDPERDRTELEQSYADPARFDGRRWFPRSSWEMQRPTRADVLGVALGFVVCFALIGLAVGLASLGS